MELVVSMQPRSSATDEISTVNNTGTWILDLSQYTFTLSSTVTCQVTISPSNEPSNSPVTGGDFLFTTTTGPAHAIGPDGTFLIPTSTETAVSSGSSATTNPDASTVDDSAAGSFTTTLVTVTVPGNTVFITAPGSSSPTGRTSTSSFILTSTSLALSSVQPSSPTMTAHDAGIHSRAAKIGIGTSVACIGAILMGTFTYYSGQMCRMARWRIFPGPDKKDVSTKGAGADNLDPPKYESADSQPGSIRHGPLPQFGSELETGHNSGNVAPQELWSPQSTIYIVKAGGVRRYSITGRHELGAEGAVQ